MIITGGIKVRWYHENELAALAEVHQECFPNQNWSALDFERFVNKRKGQIAKVIVARGRHGDMVVGSLLYRISDDLVRFARIGVRKEFRGQGIGRLAIEELISPHSVFRARLRFTAYVHELDEDACRFWQHMQFKPPMSGNLIYDHFPAGSDGIRRDAIIYEFIKRGCARRFRRSRHADC